MKIIVLESLEVDLGMNMRELVLKRQNKNDLIYEKKILEDLKLRYIFVISKEEKNSKGQKLFNI